ncbi:MAG: hypothetical protein HGB19_06970 [Chlorobiales bacterium]|nr:hypothetical protein [Chlorobiales bacterium]
MKTDYETLNEGNTDIALASFTYIEKFLYQALPNDDLHRYWLGARAKQFCFLK